MTSCSGDGATFAILKLCVPGCGSDLALVTCKEFADMKFLELLQGAEISLDPDSRGMVVLPLPQQSHAVLQRLFDQLLSRYRLAHSENRDATPEIESLIALLEQLISGR